jgi:flagellar motor switch/type III secretory pathway protein FliN
MSVAPFPFETLPRISLSEQAVGNAAAAWLGRLAAAESRPDGPPRAFGLTVSGARLVGVSRSTTASASMGSSIDASTGLVWIGREGARALVSLPGALVRAVGARILAGPKELMAPRPLTAAEQALAAMLCASALSSASSIDNESASWAVEPWQPFPDLRSALAATEKRLTGWPALDLIAAIDGREHPLRIWVPPSLVHRRPRLSAPPSWLGSLHLELPLVVASAPMDPVTRSRLQVRDVIVVEAPAGGAELRIARGSIELQLRPGASRAVIESSYRRRVKPPSEGVAGAAPSPPDAPSADALLGALPGVLPDPLFDALSDDVTAELTVTLGTVALSLRQLTELAIGQVVSLARPLHGPFELRIAGKPIGRGELVDVEGSLGVRILSLQP